VAGGLQRRRHQCDHECGVGAGADADAGGAWGGGARGGGSEQALGAAARHVLLDLEGLGLKVAGDYDADVGEAPQLHLDAWGGGMGVGGGWGEQTESR